MKGRMGKGNRKAKKSRRGPSLQHDRSHRWVGKRSCCTPPPLHSAPISFDLTPLPFSPSPFLLSLSSRLLTFAGQTTRAHRQMAADASFTPALLRPADAWDPLRGAPRGWTTADRAHGDPTSQAAGNAIASAPERPPHVQRDVGHAPKIWSLRDRRKAKNREGLRARGGRASSRWPRLPPRAGVCASL